MANLEAMQKTVSRLRDGGRIPVEGEAVVQICLSLAAAVDAAPDNAALWREYRQAEAGLRGLDTLSGGEIDELIAALRDTPNESSHARAEVGGNS